MFRLKLGLPALWPDTILRLLYHSFSFRGLTKDDYIKILWTTFAEIPGTFLSAALVDPLGRKMTTIFLFIVYAVSVMSLAGCSVGKNYLLTALFCARGSSLAVFQLLWVLTPELYPTNLRAAAMGAGSSIARLGTCLNFPLTKFPKGWRL